MSRAKDFPNADDGSEACDVDVIKVMACIPHRYPMLMVDKIIRLNPFKTAVGVKAVSIGEPYFQGHFPGHPVMPGVMLVESMAQTAGLMMILSDQANMAGKLVYFMSIDEAKFRRPVLPGDLLHIHTQYLRSRGDVWKFAGQALVEGRVVAEATFTAMARDAR